MARQETSAELRDLLLSSGLFDAEWYRSRYGDVDPSGLDPLEHFLAFGMELGRDPGPDHDEMFLEHASPGFARQGRTALGERLKGRPVAPRPGRALHGASLLADAGRYRDALRLGRAWIEPRDQNGLLILQANQALLDGRRADWLAALNGYLAHFGMAQIRLRPGSHLLARLWAAPLVPVQDDTRVSVIMAAWNAERTVGAAVSSILDQTWRNLELIVVDDASSDATWSRLRQLAARDDRVRLIRNPRNVGPYVSKNLALTHAGGTWVTGQDADDWSHPQRIERQVRAMQATGGAVKAGSALMIRMTEAGHFGAIGTRGPSSVDGVMRNALISCMFDREALVRDLGNWDSVRFGADAEMMHRARRVLGDAYRDMTIFAMLCLDHEASLTGAGGAVAGLTPDRAAYLAAFQEWHARAGAQKAGFHLPCPMPKRPFDAPAAMVVPVADADENFRAAMAEDVQGMSVLSKDRNQHDAGPETDGPVQDDPVERMLLRQNRLERQVALERSRADGCAEEVRRLTARVLEAEGGRDDLQARLAEAIAGRDTIRSRMSVEIAQLSRMVIDTQSKADLQARQDRDRLAELDRRLVQMKDALKQERRSLRKTQDMVARMERSLGWRLAGPARYLRRMMRRT